MKNRLLAILIFSVALLVVLNVRKTSSFTSGAGPGLTGSPGDAGKTCTNCHTGNASFQSGWITSTIPVGGYIAGTTYAITATASKVGVSKFGFQLSPQNTGGTLLGTLTANSETQLNGPGGKYINHTGSSTSGSNSKAWTFNWTAPTSGTGNVTFYAAFIATDGNSGSDGDQVFTSSLLVPEFNPPTVNISSVVQVLCNGACTGSAIANGSAGTSPYTYSWNSTPAQTTSNATGLCAGSYTVTITDVNSNTASASVSISQPSSALTATITSQTNVLCFGTNSGTATVEGTGGIPSYTYSWSTSPAQTTATATGLAAGAYTVTVLDANQCSKTTSATITQPASVVSASITAQTNVLCKGANTGTATVTGSGGTSSYTYSWSTTPVQTTTQATGLIAGSYSVTVRDLNLCTVTTTATVVITQPISAVAVTASATNASCGVADGTASASANGGTGTLTYSWSTTPVQTSSIATGLIAGAYTVTVTDANGCTATGSANVSNTGAPVANITSQINITGCFGDSTGSATVTATGGTGTLTYSWSTTPAQTSSIATGLKAGKHTVTVSDGVGCKQIATATITEPTVLTASSTSTLILCNGGTSTITVSPFGGTSPYTSSGSLSVTAGTYDYTVTDSKGCTTKTSITVTEPVAVAINVSSTPILCKGGSSTITVTPSGGTLPYITTGLLSVTAGTHNYTVRDNNNCTATKSITVTEPTLLTITSITSTPDTSSKNKGTATVVSGGGTSPYSYVWSNGATQSTINNLKSLVYSVTVTDKNFCTVTDTIRVGIYNSIESEISNPKFSITAFPNPAGDNFFIDITTSSDRAYELKIFSISGQLLHTDIWSIPVGKTRKNILLENEYNGMIIIQMISNEGVANIPVVVIK